MKELGTAVTSSYSETAVVQDLLLSSVERNQDETVEYENRC